MIQKDFDKWNELKKTLNMKEVYFYCKRREVWWCSLGLNVGSEQDGKNELFERPVLILKVFNKDMVRIAPITTKIKNDRNFVQVAYRDVRNSVITSQIRTISTKRLIKKNHRMGILQFNLVMAHIIVDMW